MTASFTLINKIIFSIVFMIIPITQLISGLISLKHPPKNINRIKGYRTARSMESKEAWDYANRRMSEEFISGAKLTGVIGIVAILFLFILKIDTETLVYTGILLGVIIVQTILMILPMKKIEKELAEGLHKK